MKIRLLIFTHLFVVVFNPNKSFSQAPNLGTARNFTLFTTIGAFGSTGATNISGDIGTNAGALTGFPPAKITGSIHVADVVSALVAIDTDTAYNQLLSRTCGSIIGATLGNGQTLNQNVYCIGSAATLNGNLILDGQCNPNALFIIKIDGAFSTSTFSNIVLINAASMDNVFWQINGLFTLGGGSVFSGTAIVNGAINLNTVSTINGRALSKAGAINIDNINANHYDSAVWIGSVSNDFGTAANWLYGSVPSLGNKISFTALPSNNLFLDTNRSISNFTNTSNKNIVLNGHRLSIYGTIKQNSTGKIDVSTFGSTIEMAGCYAQTIPSETFTFNKNQNLTINNNSSVNIEGKLDIFGTLTLLNGTLNTGDSLTFISNIDGTARVAAITGNGAISGNVIVERYIPSSARRWRFMSSSIANTTLEDWRNEIFLTGAGTGNTVGTLNSNGWDATISNSPSVYFYNETFPNNLNYGWTAEPTISTPIVVGKGYRVFVRGDRCSLDRLNGLDNTQNAVTMNLIGTLNTGDILMPMTYTNNNLINDDGWNLLGNPYPSQYDWDAFWDTGNAGYSGTNYSNINPTIYVWDAASNTYKSYNALANTGIITNGIIASGQGFFIKATNPSPTVTFKEQFKSSGTPLQMLKSSQDDEMRLKITLDSNDYDYFIFKNISLATNQDDAYDIKKWDNPTVNISSFGNDNIKHTLDSRPLLANNDTVNLRVTGISGTYKMTIEKLPEIGKFYFFQDLYLNKVLPLLKTTKISFSIQSSDSVSQGNNRFRIICSSTNFLPGVYGTFDAIKIGNQVQLNWNTISELNTSHFEIERSIDTSTFIKIGSITGAGNSNTILNYQLIDFLPSLTSANFYRIKLIDSDGYFNYSDIQSVSFNNTGVANILSDKFMFFPNPATDIINLSFAQKVSSNIIISIYSINGNLVKETHSISDLNEIKINDLSKGIYFLRISDEKGGTFSKKLFIE